MRENAGVKPLVRVDKISKAFGAAPVLDQITLEVRPGEILCLLGESGCGKSTLLRIIAGLEKADSGLKEVNIAEESLGFVFQEARLLPWLTVGENIKLVLPEAIAENQKNRVVQEVLEKVYLQEKSGCHPDELSGGMRQRVAIARAMAVDPGLILMDEPLSSLDFPLRLNLIGLLTELYEGQDRGGIYVTHDVREALLVADRILILKDRPSRIFEEITIELPRKERRLEMHCMEKLYHRINRVLMGGPVAGLPRRFQRMQYKGSEKNQPL
ncbi:MAG: hypothetical protein AVO33_08145 [delta proteobacterium ML8_F1]|nr:MAG: hypothetical protein AVO33_08145 [delta proteobacterium ML8_F1]